MKKLLFIVTRDFIQDEGFGRPKIINSHYETFKLFGKVTLIILKPQKFFGLTLFFKFYINLLVSFLKLRSIPLQALLFCNQTNFKKLNELDINSYDIVYTDGLRSFIPLLLLGKKDFNNSVCDFDDLMSRRYKEHLRINKVTPLGYLNENFSGFLKKLISFQFINNLIKYYESYSCKRFEIHISNLVQKVVLVSSHEANLLKMYSKNISRIIAIPPLFNINRKVVRGESFKRFVFVGSDSLVQNAVTIQYLCELWDSQKIPFELHFYGRIRHNLKNKSIFLHGYIENLGEVYTPGSILLCPSFVGGGVKTKILEALSYGIIPLGNQQSFEGISINTQSFQLSNDLRELKDPSWLDSNYERLSVNVEQAQNELEETNGIEPYKAKWEQILNNY